MLAETAAHLGEGARRARRCAAPDAALPTRHRGRELLAAARPQDLDALVWARQARDAGHHPGRRGQRPAWDGLARPLVGPWLGPRRGELYAACVEALSQAIRPPIKPAAPAPVRATPRGPGHHILVAEDNPVNQKVLVRLLEQRGHSVEAVVDGQLAVEAMQRQVYDLVLMDCQMPGMDGFEATETIRREERERSPTSARRSSP